MVSAFTPPGTRILALRSGFGIEAGEAYTVRGFVVNRHARTREPDPHVLLAEVANRKGAFGEIGFPRDAFRIPSLAGPIGEKRVEIMFASADVGNDEGSGA